MDQSNKSSKKKIAAGEPMERRSWRAAEQHCGAAVAERKVKIKYYILLFSTICCTQLL